MRPLEPLKTVGLSSDTAISSIEAAYLLTDGLDIFEKDVVLSRPYSPELREALFSVLGEKGQLDLPHYRQVEELVTQAHIQAIKDLLEAVGLQKPDVIGYLGHTVLHRPQFKISYQIGDAQKVADTFQTQVVGRFAQSDLVAGGQGAPLYASFYDALTREEEKPLAVLDIGGLASVTYIGPNGELEAFVIGPGNILINAWMNRRLGAEMDFNGENAIKGKPDERVIQKLLKYKYFSKDPPKAADRQEFDELMQDVEGMSVPDGAATLTLFVARLIAQSISRYIPQPLKKVIVCGGGAFNPTLMRFLRQSLPYTSFQVFSELGWKGKSLDAQGNAFLAVRHLFGLPISFPSTTGVSEPVSGGKVWLPRLTEASKNIPRE